METVEITEEEIQKNNCLTRWFRLDEANIMMSVVQNFFNLRVGLQVSKLYYIGENNKVSLHLDFSVISKKKIVIKLRVERLYLNHINAMVYGKLNDTYQPLPFSVSHNKMDDTIALHDKKGYLEIRYDIDLVLYLKITDTGRMSKMETNFFKTQLKDYQKILNNDELSDLTLLVSGEKLFVHKAILAARSSVFYEILLENQTLSELEILDFDVKLIKILLQFIYTSEISDELDSDIAMKMIPVSLKYSVTGLTKHIEQILIEEISTENVIQCLLSADNHILLQLKKKCLEFFVKNKKFFELDQLESELEAIGDSSLYTELIIALMKE